MILLYSNRSFLPRERCDGCGKEFTLPFKKNWLYTLTTKGKKKYYCGYACWEKAKKAHTKKDYRRLTVKNNRRNKNER